MSDRRFSAAPGPYDYPLASESSDRGTSHPAYDFDAIPTRLQDSRQRLADERSRGLFNHSSPDTSDHLRRAPLPPISPDAQAQDRMRSVLRAIHDNEGSPPSELALPPERTVHSDAHFARRRAQPSERFQRLNDQRARQAQGSAAEPSDSTFSLHEASERLARSNEGLRSLLDRPLHGNVPHSSRLVEGDDTVHASESQHRRKRRRTEGPMLSRSPSIYPVEYGYRGQVRSGSLEMEINHSDMGDLPPTYDTTEAWRSMSQRDLKNILREDQLFFAAHSRRGNIILQHPGQRFFTMKRIVIKIPDAASDEYALQGLVFTSRTIDKQFDRTTHYQVHHFPASRFGLDRAPETSRWRRLLRQAERETSFPAFPDSDEDRRGPSADCDAESNHSASDDSIDSRRPTNVVGMRIGSPSDSESESTSESSSSDFGLPEETISRLNQRWPGWRDSDLHSGLHHELRIGRYATDSHGYDTTPDDADEVAAQSDLDEVLRRGAVASAARRRRRVAATRERVRQRRQFAAESSTANRGSNNPYISRGGTRPFPETATQQSNAASSFQPRLLEPVEPPARPEDTRWNGTPRVVISDPPPPYQDASDHATAEPEIPSPDTDLSEPAAFFSTDRLMQYRHARVIRKALPSMSDPNRTIGDITESSRVPLDRHNATVNYRAKRYGGRLTIDFETPISTRYILLKLWKSRRKRAGCDGETSHENIRLTRVRVDGWCGPRYFPAIEPA